MAAAEETKEPKAFAALEPLLTYGVKPDVHGGLYFTKTDTVIYPSGCGISLYTAKEKKQELVPLADKGKHLSAIGKNFFHPFDTNFVKTMFTNEELISRNISKTFN